MPELEKHLQVMRRQDQNPDFFPRKLNRVMLGNAEAGSTKYSEALCRVAEWGLYNATHMVDGEPVFGDAVFLAEELGRSLPEIYAEILPNLEKGAFVPRVWQLLIQEVFVPTFHLQLCNANRMPHGNELSPGDCWYLPRVLRGTTEFPYQRVFQAWLNAAGCRGPEDVGKLTQSEANRKTASNWLRGKSVPHEEEISRFVKSFKEDTARFADPREWMGRLVFAAAMQRICQAIDKYFEKTQHGFSLRLLSMVDEVGNDRVPIDCDRVLFEPKTYFVACMVYRRLKKSEKWRKALEALPKGQSMTITRPVSREEMEAIQKRTRFQINPGNLLLRFIRDEIASAKGTASQCAETVESAEIFAHGIRELNGLLKEKGPMARSHRP